RSSMNYALNITQTKHSLIQIATFGLFLVAPIALFMSLLVFEFDDDSVVLIPCIFLFSLNYLVDSSLTIIYSPSIRA
ncbi:hypothetical protein PENTCL1PPCAC_15210, partial [Pristionchus entomophagus]